MLNNNIVYMNVSSQHILSLVGEWVLSISRKVIATSANIENDRIFETVQWMELTFIFVTSAYMSLFSIPSFSSF